MNALTFSKVHRLLGVAVAELGPIIIIIIITIIITVIIIISSISSIITITTKVAIVVTFMHTILAMTIIIAIWTMVVIATITHKTTLLIIDSIALAECTCMCARGAPNLSGGAGDVCRRMREKKTCHSGVNRSCCLLPLTAVHPPLVSVGSVSININTVAI